MLRSWKKPWVGILAPPQGSKMGPHPKQEHHSHTLSSPARASSHGCFSGSLVLLSPMYTLGHPGTV